MQENKPSTQTTDRVTAKMLRAGHAAVIANRWHQLPIDILKAIYLAMEAARANGLTQQMARTDEVVERIFRECNLMGALGPAKLSFGCAIDAAREDGRREMAKYVDNFCARSPLCSRSFE